jgi:hypothetical protein
MIQALAASMDIFITFLLLPMPAPLHLRDGTLLQTLTG